MRSYLPFLLLPALALATLADTSADRRPKGELVDRAVEAAEATAIGNFKHLATLSWFADASDRKSFIAQGEKLASGRDDYFSIPAEYIPVTVLTNDRFAIVVGWLRAKEASAKSNRLPSCQKLIFSKIDGAWELLPLDEGLVRKYASTPAAVEAISDLYNVATFEEARIRQALTGIKPDEQEFWQAFQPTFSGQLANQFMTALSRRDLPLLSEMLRQTPNLANLSEFLGRTPLYQASASHDYAAVDLLLKSGADPNAKLSRQQSYRTPLHGACKSGRIATPNDPKAKTIARLIASGANVNAADGSGLTPLHFAAKRADLALIEVLLAAGAKVDEQDKHGAAPLVLVGQPREPSVRALLEAEADPNQLYQKTPIAFLFYRMGERNLVKLLHQFGADLSYQTKIEGKNTLFGDASGGVTLAHLAAEANDRETLSYLLDKKVSVDAKDAQNKTPLDYCNDETASWLREQLSAREKQ